MYTYQIIDMHAHATAPPMNAHAAAAALVALAYVLAAFELPRLLRDYMYGLALYGFVTFIMDGPAALLIALLDMRVAPPFDKPWMSTSLADFWGR